MDRFERVVDAYVVGAKVSFSIPVSNSGSLNRSLGNVGNPDDPKVRKGREVNGRVSKV